MNDASPKVTAVVVTYQSAQTMDALLRTAHRCHEAGALKFVFVDNGSTDETAEILSRQSDWANVVLSEVNNGFGRGCNLGLAKVDTQYTLFLNPDAEIEPDAVESLVSFMESNPKVGIAGPATICGESNGLQHFQGTSDLPTPAKVFLSSAPLIKSDNKMTRILPGSEPFNTQWVCGAVFMIRTNLAQRLGGFDERFFLYWEEMDLCRRAADMGFETWAVGTSVARHIGGASSAADDTRLNGCIGKHYYQSRRYYMIKHHGWAVATISEIGEYVFLWGRTLIDLLSGKGFSRIRPRLQAALLSQPEQRKSTI